MVIVAAGIIIGRRIQNASLLPINIIYVGTGSFSNAPGFGSHPNDFFNPNAFLPVRPGPTFSITNHTSKNLVVLWTIEVRNGTNWIRDPSDYRSVDLLPNTGAYVTVGMLTNKFRIAGNTSEALKGAASVLAGLKYYSRSLLDKRFSQIPFSTVFSTNQTWYGNHHDFVSEEVLDPKSRQ